MTSKKPKTIVWEDAVSVLNNTDDEIQKRPPDLVETYGIVIHKCPKYTIIMTHNSHGEGNDYVRVPTPLVRRVK